MNDYTPGATLPWDWHAGTIPANVAIDPTAYVETTFSFDRLKSRRPEAVRIGRGAATYLGTMFDLGVEASVEIGEFAFVHGVWFISDARIEIGPYSMLSWNIVLMDNYRISTEAAERRPQLQNLATSPDRRLRGMAHDARPIRIGANVWIGFDVCVMPGVTVGDGAIVGAKSGLFEDVPPYTIAAGNPARVIRELTAAERSQGA